MQPLFDQFVARSEPSLFLIYYRKARMLTKRVVLLRKAFHDLQDVRKHETYSWDMLDRTIQATIKAKKQIKKDKHFRRANHDEFAAVLDEIVQDLEMIKHKLAEGT